MNTNDVRHSGDRSEPSFSSGGSTINYPAYGLHFFHFNSYILSHMQLFEHLSF